MACMLAFYHFCDLLLDSLVVCFMMYRMSSTNGQPLNNVLCTYHVKHEGKWYKKQYRVWPLDLDGRGDFQYYCPFSGCVLHPERKKGCSRSTMNRHGREIVCQHVTYREPKCDYYRNDGTRWFELVSGDAVEDAVEADAPETHAGARYVNEYV